METIDLALFAGDWRAIVATMQQSNLGVALVLDGAVCGVLLPAPDAARLVRYFTPHEQPKPRFDAAARVEPQNYLELLRHDATLVPMVEGVPLDFVTMMNSSYVDPEQIYQFRHPRTLQIYLFRESELQEAIGRTFKRVSFIPAHPKDFVDGKH